MNEIIEHKQTPDFGPQSPSDNPFTAKARKLQSLWRVKNGLKMGVGPNKNSTDKNTGEPAFYGNMIQEGEKTGRNFYFPETFAYAQWRVAKKMNDERCFPAIKSMYKVQEIGLEFIPTPIEKF